MMNQAIGLNNEAVAYLQKGDVFEACNYLTEASGIFLQTTEQSGRQRYSHKEHVIMWVNFAHRRVHEFPTGVYHYAAVIETKRCSQQQRPKEGGSCQSRSYSADDQHVCPCNIAPILWYNLALCCHLLGAELGGGTADGSFYYMRSIYLYEKVLNVYIRGNNDPARASLSTLLLAALNNQACIHFETGSFNEYNSLMTKLKRCLRTGSRPSLHNRSWTVFHKNMSIMDSEQPRSAAAA